MLFDNDQHGLSVAAGEFRIVGAIAHSSGSAVTVAIIDG
jgi:hypothetical protein